ncbi:ASPIC/UnbV domain-containing protein [Verrucomicrobiales bacterium]|nr:ASPIC/UnbV domain-containing protein [Verrucomicrobiales bacterium]
MNMSGREFADFSHLSGLGLDDDGRALAVCDWDRDGDQDIWFRNRNAPRLRLMLNDSANHNRSVSLRLEGVLCNRDAIGARVTLKTGNGIMVRSLRAGEMFLSQSTKWLHFGMDINEQVNSLIVSWPGGEDESFSGVKRGGRYLLKEGQGKAVNRSFPSEASLKLTSVVIKKKNSLSDYVYLPVEVPFPRLSYRAPDAKIKEMRLNGAPLLVTFWNSSIQKSSSELESLEEERVRMNAMGIDSLALSVDGIERAGLAYELITKSNFQGNWGFIPEESFSLVKRWRGTLFELSAQIEFPFSLLLNSNGNCVAIYRSRVSGEMIRSMSRLVAMDELSRWHNAPLLRGSWFTNPVSKNYVRLFLEQRMKR